MRFLAKLLASGFGAGFSPIAPGTAGSALAAVIIYFCAGWWNPPAALTVSAAIYLLGVACCHLAEKDWGRDSSRLVIDEIAGMFLSVSLLRVELKTLIVAFLFFRLFDIVKPAPASRAENLPSGWGVMTDDTVAAAYTLVLMLVLGRWI